MSRSIPTQKRRRRVCIGDLRDRVVLHDRAIVEPEFGVADFTEKFTAKEEVWARVESVQGKTFFDGVNSTGAASGDIALTHEITVRFDPTVGAETWVEFKGNRFDVVNAENLEERDEFLLLRCVERGAKSQAAVDA